MWVKVEDDDKETGIRKDEISVSIELDTSKEKNDDSDENCFEEKSEENTSVKENVDRKHSVNKHKFICDICGVFCKSKLKALITVLLQNKYNSSVQFERYE